MLLGSSTNHLLRLYGEYSPFNAENVLPQLTVLVDFSVYLACSMNNGSEVSAPQYRWG